MERALEASGLEWVILRPAVLTDDPTQENRRVFSPETSEKAHKITRADLASFMLAQLTTDERLHQAVTITNN